MKMTIETMDQVIGQVVRVVILVKGRQGRSGGRGFYRGGQNVRGAKHLN